MMVHLTHHASLYRILPSRAFKHFIIKSPFLIQNTRTLDLRRFQRCFLPFPVSSHQNKSDNDFIAIAGCKIAAHWD